jgi:hypothetical protein
VRAPHLNNEKSSFWSFVILGGCAHSSFFKLVMFSLMFHTTLYRNETYWPYPPDLTNNLLFLSLNGEYRDVGDVVLSFNL